MSTVARVVEVLEGAGVSYAVCGAFALAAHGASRATVDLDLAVAGDAPVDVVVFGPNGWQREAIERAMPVRVGVASLRILRAEDLVLFKLYAAGPQDGWDVQSLLAGHPDEAALVGLVKAALPGLPPRARRLWARVREGR